MSFLQKNKNFYKSFFILTLGVGLQNVLAFSVNLSDSILLGAYSENALAAVAIVNQIQFLLQMVVLGVSEGVVVLASRYWGQNDLEPISRVTGIGLRIGLLSSLIIWGFVFFMTGQVIGLLTNDPGVLAESVKYARIICFSYMFFALTNIFLAAMRSVETIKIAFIISSSTLAINVTLNLILIYGNLGAPRMGIQGSAVATLLARIVELIIVCFYIFRLDKKLKLKIKTLLKKPRRDMLKQFFKVGMPVTYGNLSWGVAMAVQTAIIGRLGLTTIAANGIATTVFQIVSVVAYGGASAATVLTGKVIGQGDMAAIKKNTRTMQVLFLLIGAASGITLFLFRNLIIGAWAVTPDAQSLALQFMGILSVTVVGTAYQVACLTGIVRGGGDTKFVFYNDIIFMWCIVLPLSLLSAFVFHFSPVVVFACLKMDQILKCFVAVFKVNRYTWIKKFN
jgi:putative MATE family efflux protein